MVVVVVVGGAVVVVDVVDVVVVGAAVVVVDDGASLEAGEVSSAWAMPKAHSAPTAATTDPVRSFERRKDMGREKGGRGVWRTLSVSAAARRT